MEQHYLLLDHVQLAIPKDGEIIGREFYEGVLGFKEIEKPERLQKNGGVWFQAGDVHIHLGIEEPFIPAKKAHPAIKVKEIRLLMEYLCEKGIEMKVDKNIPQAKRFYIADPFGNRIEFIEWIK